MTNWCNTESYIPSILTKSDELTKTRNYYFLFMRLLYRMLQNAIYQSCQQSSKLLRIQSVDFSIVGGAGASAQAHCMCFLIFDFFFLSRQVSIFTLLPSLEVKKLSVRPTNTYCVAIFLSQKHSTNCNHTLGFICNRPKPSFSRERTY